MHQHYDTYCLNQQCIHNKRAFFNYTSSDNEHQTNHHQIKLIHTFSFKELERKEGQVRKNSYEDQPIQEMVLSEERKIASFIGERYLMPFVMEMMNKYRNEPELTSKVICQRMKRGDYQLLDAISSYQKTSKDMPFQDYYERHANKIKNIQNQLSALADKIKAIFQIAFQNFREIDQIKMASEMENKEGQKKNEDKRRTGKGKGKGKDIRDEDNDNTNSMPQKNRKIKKLPHPSTASRRQSQNTLVKYQQPPQTQLVDCSHQLQKLSQTQIKILSCSNPQNTMKYIIHTYKSLSAIHIFHHKFATNKVLSIIFKQYPCLRVMTLNCLHQFRWDMLDHFKTYNRQNITKLEVKWALDLFFGEYHLLKQFRRNVWSKRERNTRTGLSLQTFNSLPANDTLWIQGDDHSIALAHASRSFKNVKVMHCAPAASQALHLKHISYPELTNLTTLALKQTNLDHWQLFKQVLLKNKQLQALMISNCFSLSKHIDSIMDTLSELPLLNKFSLMRLPTEMMLVNPSKLFKLKKLQYLYLEHIKFSNLSESASQNAGSSCLVDICQLKSLKHLSLSACTPVYYDLFIYLDPECFQQLQFLSISTTDVDDRCIQQLAKMKNLRYLNIDDVSISGNGFVKLCKTYQILHGKPWGLKELSMGEMERREKKKQGLQLQQRFKSQNLGEMVRLLPQLQYIDIENCKQLRNFDFGTFKSLRTIAMNKQQAGMMAYVSDRIEVFISDANT